MRVHVMCCRRDAHVTLLVARGGYAVAVHRQQSGSGMSNHGGSQLLQETLTLLDEAGVREHTPRPKMQQVVMAMVRMTSTSYDCNAGEIRDNHAAHGICFGCLSTIDAEMACAAIATMRVLQTPTNLPTSLPSSDTTCAGLEPCVRRFERFEATLQHHDVLGKPQILVAAQCGRLAPQPVDIGLFPGSIVPCLITCTRVCSGCDHVCCLHMRSTPTTSRYYDTTERAHGQHKNHSIRAAMRTILVVSQSVVR